MNPRKVEELLQYLASLREDRDKINEKIGTVTGMLARAGVGHYDNGTISQVKKARVEVRSYTRAAHRVIRTK